jgi:arabinoxylan arabinofuranohydrolase
MTSKNPLGPFEYKGYTLENPGTYFGAWGNNHHWIFSFKGKWYIAYHTQTLEKTVGCEKGGYRNIFINDFAVNADGSLPVQKVTKKGVEQVCNFTLGQAVPAATFAASRNVAVTNNRSLVSIKDGAYVCIKGVEFTGKEKSFEAETVAAEEKAIKLLIDGFAGNGTEICQAECGAAGRVEGAIKGVSGIHDLYIVLPEGVELINWCIK